MKKIILLFTASIVTSIYAQNSNSLNFILQNYKGSANNIIRIEYNIQSIDTFANGGVWNHKGFAFIEREKSDKLFGFYFSGIRFDINEQDIYDGKNEIRIDKNKKSYKIEKPREGYLGSPGGQMIVKELLFPDTTYKNVKLLNETKDSYILEYQYKDDTIFNVTNETKIIELSKSNYLPIKITLSYLMLGKRAVNQVKMSNLKINSKTTSPIDQIKKELVSYKLTEETKSSKSLTGTKAPEFLLPEISNTNDKTELPKDKLSLLDFWEVWCVPCILSLPKIEKISNEYSNNLKVIGIVTDDTLNARKLIKKKGITFTNLIGNKSLLTKYEINSYPRYFLVDKNRNILKEYYGFSSQIKKDILQYLKK